jgi:hypothetical protein
VDFVGLEREVSAEKTVAGFGEVDGVVETKYSDLISGEGGDSMKWKKNEGLFTKSVTDPY